MYLFFNHKFYPDNTPIIAANAHAFRYGYSVFETIKYQNNNLLFYQNHYNRLIGACELLQFHNLKPLTAPTLKLQITSLLQKNKLQHARVRITLFTNSGGLFDANDNTLNILIETFALENHNYQLNSNGLNLCLYTQNHKSINTLSNYKTGNHLIYQLSAKYAQSQHCNQALLLNTHKHICDSTISNVFIIKNNQIYTPPITDGAIKGIMRQYIMSKHTIHETSITLNQVLTADEVFLTNTIKGIQWVKHLENSSYKNTETIKLFNTLIEPLNLPQNY